MQITSSIRDIVERALVEDLGHGDVTTDALIPPDARGQASVVVKADGVVAGLEVALDVFRQVDPSTQSRIRMADGAPVSPGAVVADLEGSVAGILKAERVALNFLQRLSGIATATNAYVKAVHGTKARIIDTRKTVPGLRQLEKYAVRVGGGHNHRYNLADGILIKDNHIAALRARELGLAEIVDLARERSPHTLRVEIEVETVDEAFEAVEARRGRCATGQHVAGGDAPRGGDLGRPGAAGGVGRRDAGHGSSGGGDGRGPDIGWGADTLRAGAGHQPGHGVGGRGRTSHLRLLLRLRPERSRSSPHSSTPACNARPTVRYSRTQHRVEVADRRSAHAWSYLMSGM